MSTLQSQIELYDAFSAPMMNIINAVNLGMSAMVDMQGVMDDSFDTVSIDGARDAIDQASIAMQQLEDVARALENPISENTRQQEEFTGEIWESDNAAQNLARTLQTAVAGYVGIAGVRKAFSFIEDCMELFDTQRNAENQLMVVLGNMLNEDYVAGFELVTTADTTAAVNAINAIGDEVGEITVPVTAEGRALQAEFDAITKKASEIQGLGIYGDEAMIAGAAEFATYFSELDAITMMMDTLADYAMGMSGGGALDANAMVDYATGLGKIMSGSYDAMTKKGFEFSDAQKAIIEGTAEQEQIVAILGDEYAAMSEEMQAAAVISQVISEGWGDLYETMSDTPEGKIIQLTNAWGDMKEVVGGQLYPYIMLFADTIQENWPTIEVIVYGITEGLQFMVGVLSWLADGAFDFARIVSDNWGMIAPVVAAIVGAVMLYHGVQLAANTVSLASQGIHVAMAGAQMLHALATGTLTSATFAEITAQNGLNASLYACPIVWIVALIIAFVAAIYAGVAAVNHLAGTSISATGVICGSFTTLAAMVGNIFVSLINFVIDIFVVLWNFIAAYANYFGNVFNDPVGAIARLFFDLADTVLGILESLASAIDTVFGSNLAGAVSGWRDSLGGWVDETFGQGEEIMAKMDASSMHLNGFDYDEAWNAGYNFGQGIEDTISDFDPANLFKVGDIPSPEDYMSSYSDIFTSSGMPEGIESIAGNTGAIRDSIDISAEDLKYMRDIAEQESINRFTLADVHIEQTNHNNINSSMDLDGIISGMTDAVSEAIETSTEGVHM